MAFSDFRDTYSWKGAVELGPHLARLADELPASEQMGLALQLREGMVHLVAGIGLDLLDGDLFVRRRHAVRLLATLDLVDHVYPALDTAAARDGLDKLLERLSGPDFDERKGKPRSAQTARPQSAHPGAVHPTMHPAAPHPAPESVPVVPEPAPAPSGVAANTPGAPAMPAPSQPFAPGVHPSAHPTDVDTNPALKVAVHPDAPGSGHQEA